MNEPFTFERRDVETKDRTHIGRSITAALAVVLGGIIAGVIATAVGQIISRGL